MNEAEIRKIVEASPLAAHSDEIMALAIPAVKMNSFLVEDGDLPLGASRMGGAPDLPPGTPWPENKGRPADFLAQIDFAAVAKAHSLPGIPDSGWVALFRDFQSGFDGDYDDNGQWRWAHFDCPADQLARTEHPGEPLQSFNFCELKFEPELCLPGDFADRFTGDDEALGEEVFEYFDETLNDIMNGPYHRIGGYPMLIQSSENDLPGWDFLMQIDSDNEVGWMWGDMGRIYYWGRRKDPVGELPTKDSAMPPLDRHFSEIFVEDEFY